MPLGRRKSGKIRFHQEHWKRVQVDDMGIGSGVSRVMYLRGVVYFIGDLMGPA